MGVIDSPDEINSDSTVAIFPTSLLREDVGSVATVMQVRLRPDYAGSDTGRPACQVAMMLPCQPPSTPRSQRLAFASLGNS